MFALEHRQVLRDHGLGFFYAVPEVRDAGFAALDGAEKLQTNGVAADLQLAGD